MRFGLVHRIMTDALAGLGIFAVVSTQTMSPWANIAVVIGFFAAIAIPDAWQTKPALRQFATVGPLAVFVIQGVRLVLGHPWLDVFVEFGTMLQVVRIATRRGAAHDQQIILLALIHFVAGTVLGGGLTYGLCFLGFLIVAPGALVLSHLRREVEGNYRQGARDRTGLPVDVPRILRSRRVVGRGFLAATCLLALPIFFFTAILFVMFPRVGLSLLLLQHPHNDRMIGFTERIKLDEVGLLRDNPEIVLRFEVSEMQDPPPARYPLRFRGTAFDTTDGVEWSRSLPDRHPDSASPPDVVIHQGQSRTDRTVSIDLDPIEPPVVFLPPRTVAVHVKRPPQSVLNEPIGIHQGPEEELRYTGNEGRGLRYDAVVDTSTEPLAEPLPQHDRARYLSVPAKLSPRIGELAHRWSDGLPTQAAKAHSIEEHLRSEYSWDRNSPSTSAADPLDDFLFVSHRGHCTFFSTAMAVMLREVGIPSRNVTGLVGGTYNRFGRYYAVRQGDAHSWVEAYIADQQAWVTYDATPAVGVQPVQAGALGFVRDLAEALSQRWNHYIVNYDLKTQMHLFEDMGRRYDRFRKSAGVNPNSAADKLTSGPVVAISFIVLSYGGYWFWKRRRRPGDKTAEKTPKDAHTRALETATALYRALENALSLHGLSRPASTPPLRHAEDMERRRHPLAEEVLALTQIYLESRFGGKSITDAQKRDFERRVREVRAYKPEPKVPAISPKTAAA